MAADTPIVYIHGVDDGIGRQLSLREQKKARFQQHWQTHMDKLRLDLASLEQRAALLNIGAGPMENLKAALQAVTKAAEEEFKKRMAEYG